MAIKRVDLSQYQDDKKHEAIIDAFDSLDVGERMILINDYDPSPMLDHLVSEMDANMEFEHIKQGPDEWQSLISKRYYNFI